MADALRRELCEEIGVEVEQIQPAFFKDGVFDKLLPDGSKQTMYLIFLVFHCRALSQELHLNEEFSEYRWVEEKDWYSLDLNRETKDTLARIRRTGSGDDL